MKSLLASFHLEGKLAVFFVELNEDLKKKIKTTFEPRYGRVLEDFEIEQIVQNMLQLTEVAFAGLQRQSLKIGGVGDER